MKALFFEGKHYFHTSLGIFQPLWYLTLKITPIKKAEGNSRMSPFQWVITDDLNY